MKTFALPILMLTFLVGNLSAQERSSFDLMFGVDYSNRTNTKEVGLTFTDDNGDVLPLNVVGSTDIRFGLSYNHRIGKKIWVKTGVRYTRIGYKYEVEQFDFGVIGDSKSINDSHHSFIEIPLLFRYELTSNKWSPFVELGMAANYYLQTKQKNSFISSTHNSENEKLEKIETISQGQYSAIASIGIQYQLSEQFQLTFQPAFRYFLTRHLDRDKVPDINFFDYRNYSLGLEMGCRMMI